MASRSASREGAETRVLRHVAGATARPEAMQRNGTAMVVAGWILTVAGVVAYCVASFAAGVDADLGAILLENMAPLARAALVVMGAGTLLWLVGSFVYLRGAMDADVGSDAELCEREGAGRRR